MNEYPADTMPSGEIVPFDQPSQDLVEIIAGAARRDPRSISCLYDRFEPIVNRLVWRLLGADNDHNDVVHDAFVNILESIGEIKTPGLLEQWIRSVTVNTVRRELRRRKFYRFFHVSPDMEARCTLPAGTDGHLALRRVYDALDTMSTTDRIVFVLRYVEGYTPGEIGAICDGSPSWVRWRVSRARDEFLSRAGDEFVRKLAKGANDE